MVTEDLLEEEREEDDVEQSMEHCGPHFPQVEGGAPTAQDVQTILLSSPSQIPLPHVAMQSCGHVPAIQVASQKGKQDGHCMDSPASQMWFPQLATEEEDFVPVRHRHVLTSQGKPDTQATPTSHSSDPSFFPSPQ